MYKVYKIVNVDGVVEYVGRTKNLARRYKEHVVYKSYGQHNRGKFYGRTDVTMELICECPNLIEARETEKNLQALYNVVDNIFYGKRQFTNEDIIYIRNSTKSNRVLASEFNCGHNSIGQIKNYLTYRELP